MTKLRKPKKSSSKKSGPERVLVDCSPHRTTGGRYIEGLTSFPIEHESHNEKHALWLLPLCHDVLKISTQASKEPFIDSVGAICHHTPDITLETTGGPLILEMKSLSWLVKEKELTKYLAIARGYIGQKKRFAFLTDAQLMQKPLFQSINLLRRYVECEPRPHIYAQVAQRLQEGPQRINDLMAITPVQLVDVYVLIAHKFICFDWTKALDPDAFISLPNEPFEGLKLENILRSTRHGRLLEELALGRRPADKSVLADAADWRQSRQPPTPFQFVGGFSAGPYVCDRGENFPSTGTAWSRRHWAPGAQPLKTDFA